MSSILNNSAALSALQSLQMTQQSLSTVQNEVSTGLSVANASDNSSYWSIAQQLSSDSGIVTASQSALSEGQSVLSTATSALNSVLTTLNSMATQLTQAQNPGASLTNINTALASLGSQLTDAVNGASFNGLNVLDGSQSSVNSGLMSFVAGFNASSTGGSVNYITFQTQALLGNTAAAATTTTSSTMTDATQMKQVQAVEVAAEAATSPNTKTVLTSTGTPAASYGADAYYYDAANGIFQDQSVALDGTVTTNTYTALDANGNSVVEGGTPTFATAASYAVTTSVTTTASNLLNQGAQNLTTIGTTPALSVTAANAATALQNVNSAIAAITNYAGVIGATQDRMTTASNFDSALTTDYSNGVAGLVDANMNTASTQLQALQTQEQLGIQSLSIANQNSQLILKLFQ